MLPTESHQEIRETVREFVDTEINPFADEWEEAKTFPAHELFKKAGARGLLGLHRSEEYGGEGLDFSHSVVMAEEQVGWKLELRRRMVNSERAQACGYWP